MRDNVSDTDMTPVVLVFGGRGPGDWLRRRDDPDMTKRTTNEAFDEFDENLKLNPKERAAAERCHNEVTELLRSVGLIVYAVLQGSFARKTMIRPLRDIDKVVILAPALRGLTPDQVMDRIQAVLAARYPDATFQRTRHSLQIDFGPTTFYFDIVPAWDSSTDDDDVLIANRETGTWERSNTRELMRVVAERNGDTRGRFIHEVRMGKQAVKHLLDGIVPGLHVESWAYIAIEEPMAHDAACALIFETGARLLGGRYFDPTGKDLISARLKPDVVERAKPVLVKAAADARAALRLAEDGKHEAAIKIWHAIFGDDFPAPSTAHVAALRSSFLGAGVTGAGKVSHAAGQKAKPTRSWRPE